MYILKNEGDAYIILFGLAVLGQQIQTINRKETNLLLEQQQILSQSIHDKIK